MKKDHSPKPLSKEELKILQEPDVYRFKGERVEDALYRDYQKRQARAKLLTESVISILITHYCRSNK
jgi:hypothetical protein